MKSLTNQFISDLYTTLLHTENTSLSGGITRICDGAGNDSVLSLGTKGTSGSIEGSFTVTNTFQGDNIIYPHNPSVVAITLIDYLYPVGAVYISTETSNPASRFLGTTWEQISQGRFLAGVGASTDKNGSSKTFSLGNNTGLHRQTINDLPPHKHFTVGDDVTNAFGPLLAGGNTVCKGFAIANDTAYHLVGNTTPATLGPTSTTGSISATNPEITPQAYALYVWKRTA